jgi:hypothetical protein
VTQAGGSGANDDPRPKRPFARMGRHCRVERGAGNRASLKRYRAEISLGFFERIVSNETIESRLREAGFSDVRVSGRGATRLTEALWPGLDTTATMPAKVSSIVEVTSDSSSV